MDKVISTGMFADMGSTPWILNSTDEYNDWYRSMEAIPGDHPYGVHLSNKKWPLKEVVYHKLIHLIYSRLRIVAILMRNALDAAIS